MTATKAFLSLLGAVFVAGLLVAAPAQAQQLAAPKMLESHGAKSRGTGTDESIKTQRAPNKPDAASPAPANKGGEASRGASGIVHTDNRTALWIDVYLNGDYCGTLSPWGDIYCYVSAGTTVMYAVAGFTDGSRTTWGPSSAYVDGEYIWRLWP
jgi:hypothetical protein